MKMHISRDWVRKFEDDDDMCITAMSPRLYAYSRLTTYALIDPVAKTIMHLYTNEWDFTAAGDDRICWATNRLERYLHRKNPDFKKDSSMARINSLMARIDENQ